MAKKKKKVKRGFGYQKQRKPVSVASAVLEQALTLHEAGRLAEAENLYRQILQAEPDHAEALHCLGILAYQVGKWGTAAALIGRVITLRPDFAEAHYNLGNALDELGNRDQAAASYRRALTLKPDYVEAYYNLGLLLQGQGKPDEAESCYRQAISLKPDYVEAHNNLGIALKDQGKPDEAIASFRRALSLWPDYTEAHSNLLFCLNYLPDQFLAGYLEEARRYGRKATAGARAPFSDWNYTAQPERLRVGLVSDDFRNHPVGYFLENMLANIDPARIELIAYPISNIRDELTARLQPRFGAWHSLQGVNDENAARLIHQDGVHVLLDLAGHTSNNRLPLFAWKPALVQATWLGYFASTGIAEMDFIIADPISIPESHREHFTEKVWCLPETRVCFSPPAPSEEIPVTELPALHNGFITFGCFQNLAKLNDGVLGLWGKLFELLPLARLRLQNPLSSSSPLILEQLQVRLSQNGIAPERVIIEKAVPRMEYLAAHAGIDIILDTFPFSGLTTTCEALWMGVPTVTLAGDMMVARQGASLLTCAGLADWIAKDQEEYVAKTLAHAADLEKLALLRAGLRQQVLESSLFDGKRFARDFETALWDMWNYIKKD